MTQPHTHRLLLLVEQEHEQIHVHLGRVKERDAGHVVVLQGQEVIKAQLLLLHHLEAEERALHQEDAGFLRLDGQGDLIVPVGRVGWAVGTHAQ